MIRIVLLGGLLMAIVCSLNGADNSGKQLPLPSLDPEAGISDSAPRHAVFAGGCFWCVEGVFQELKGVHEVVSGYAGGDPARADYESVCSGTTGHAEVVQISYDPSVISYGRLLQVFFSTHDPTQLNAQGPDTGSQYRSAVFYMNDTQHETAAAYIAQLEAAKVFSKPIVTTLEKLTTFHAAEGYHQDFVDRNPDQGYVRAIALPKVGKARTLFPDLTE